MRTRVHTDTRPVPLLISAWWPADAAAVGVHHICQRVNVPTSHREAAWCSASSIAGASRVDFAPTDEAFAALPEGTVENLLKPENKEQLAAILTYHVVSGKIMSADIAGKTAEVATVQGSNISVNAMNGVMVDNATVVAADIEADNGVIHVIDQVVLPN